MQTTTAYTMSQASQMSQDDGNRHWLENILPLLTEARGMFAGDEEINKVYEVSENLQKMDQARSYELDTLREKLRAHARQAESYKHSAQRPANVPTEKQHEAKLVELDAKKYGLAKTVADLEQAIASSEMGLSRNKTEVQQREREDPTADSGAGLSDVLKLQLFRGMGFIPVEQGGIQTKLLISSGSDLHALATNGGLSEFEYSSRAWQMAS